MRDPARIDRIVDQLRRVWYANPDQRLGQLVHNLLGDRTWVPEDDVTEQILRAVIDRQGDLGAGIDRREELISRLPRLSPHPPSIACHPGDRCVEWPECWSCGPPRL